MCNGLAAVLKAKLLPAAIIHVRQVTVSKPVFRGGGWHIGTCQGPRAPKEPRATAVTAATGDGSSRFLSPYIATT